jgi:hypothetical protein
MGLIEDWIRKTNSEISSRPSSNAEFDRFIQLYFLLNNLLKQSNDRHGIFPRPNDTKIITEFLPEFLDEKWRDFREDSDCERSANVIYLAMNYYIYHMLDKNYFANPGIQRKQIKVLVELVKTGYFHNSTGYQNKPITKSDYDSFMDISKYNLWKNEKLKNLIKGTLKTVYAVRNNFYHGSKSLDNPQNELLELINLSIIKLIKLLYDVENLLSTGTLTFWMEISEIETDYEEKLKKNIKKRIDSIYKHETADIKKWSSSTIENNGCLSFSYYFITLDRLNSIIEYGTFKKFNDIIKAIEYLNNHFSISISGLDDMRSDYEECKQYRNHIFHGNEEINLGHDLSTMNRKLSRILNKVREVLDSIN